MTMWHHLTVCICCSVFFSVASRFQLEPQYGNVSLGEKFTFTLRVSKPDIKTDGLLQFIHASSNMCSMNIKTEDKTSAEAGSRYDCGAGPENGSYFLQIYNFSRADSGQWTCHYGTNQCNLANIHLNDPPSVEIQPVAPCQGFTFSVMDTDVSLRCSVKSWNQAPSIFRWYHNNKTVGYYQIYHIPAVTRSSEGLYKCEAKNNQTSYREHLVTVNVHYPPVVIVPNKAFVVNESHELDIPCMANANPNVTSIVWTKKGVNTTFPRTNGVLELRNLQKQDKGTYICTAGNTLTTCNGTKQETGQAEVKVEIQYKPVIESFRIRGVDGQEDDTVPERVNVTLRCEVDSHPRVDIEIEKDGKLVNQKRDGSSLSFIIRRAECQDRGNYTCSAKNLLGEVKSDTIQLLVTCKPRPADGSSAKIIMTAAINGNVEFKQEVIAYPKPLFTLRKSETQIYVASDTNPTWDGLKATGTITLHNIGSEQFGSYILRVNNTEGELDYKIDLRLKSKPEKPGNLQVYNVNTRSLSLSWEEGFNGGAVQNFTVEYRQNGGQWIKHPTILSEEYDFHLDLSGLESSTDYELRVSANNEYGSSEYTSINAKTRSDGKYGLYGGVGGAVLVIFAVIVVAVVCKTRIRKGPRDTRSSRDPSEDDDELVMEDPQPTTSGERGHNYGDVYAVVQKPCKKNEPDEAYANTGANAVGNKTVPKTGRDGDGLLYVGVDFGKKPTSGVIIGADIGAGQYSAIDFRSLGGAQDKEVN